MNIAERLSREICRVERLKASAVSLKGAPGTYMGWYITACEAAIDAGYQAIGGGDIALMVAAIKELQEISE